MEFRHSPHKAAKSIEYKRSLGESTRENRGPYQAKPLPEIALSVSGRSIAGLSSVCGILTGGQSWRPGLLRTASASMMRSSLSRVTGNRPVKRKPRLCSGLSIFECAVRGSKRKPVRVPIAIPSSEQGELVEALLHWLKGDNSAFEA